eukprot:1159515-Pelagomonas_calceolata.AAC.5
MRFLLPNTSGYALTLQELAQRTALIDAAIARLQNCAEVGPDTSEIGMPAREWSCVYTFFFVVPASLTHPDVCSFPTHTRIWFLQFARCDTAPLVSLGDALMAKAELNPSVKSVLTPEAGSMASSPSVPEILGAAALLQQALKDGYSAALHINKGTTEAQLGFAEAHAGLARLAASTGAYQAKQSSPYLFLDDQRLIMLLDAISAISTSIKSNLHAAAGDLAAAAQYLQQAAAAYESVLRVPEEIGGFRERCDVRYNAMCVLALASRDAEACSILQQLIACGAVSTSDVAKDPDLAGRPWVQQLLLSSHDVCLEGEGMA